MASGSKGTGTRRNTSTSSSRARSGNGAKRATSTGSTRSTGGRGGATQRKKQQSTAATSLQNEIILMITLVVSVLLLLSHFNLGGAVGAAINGVMFGLFGIVAYLFPFILFFGMAFFLANRGSRALTAKMLYALGMLFMLTAFIQLLTTYQQEQLTAAEVEKEISVLQYYTLAKANKKGGGIFGGLICYLFEPLFGTVGSYVVVIALFLVFFMLFSRKAIFALIAKRSNERYALHKVHAMERRESYEERQAERARLVEEKRKELGERRAKTYLLSEEEKAKMEPALSGGGVQKPEKEEQIQQKQSKEEKRNTFWKKTPANDYALDLNNQYTLPQQTISEVNALYGEEKKRKMPAFV